MNEKMEKTLYAVLAIASFFLAWELLTAFTPAGETTPGPVEVLRLLFTSFFEPIGKFTIYGHLYYSIRRVLVGYVVATVLGIIVGIAMGTSRYAEAIIKPLFELIRPIPPIAWIPIVIMWFGLGEFPKVLLVFIGTFVPLVINTSAGIEMVDRINIHVGRIFGGNNKQILKEIVIPTALPSIFAGIRTSVSSGWTTVLAAEMMGAQQGLGSLVTRGWQGSDLSLVLVSVITIAVIGAILAVILQKLEKVVCPWNNK